MFGISFGLEIDMWSLGCILAEVLDWHVTDLSTLHRKVALFDIKIPYSELSTSFVKNS